MCMRLAGCAVVSHGHISFLLPQHSQSRIFNPAMLCYVIIGPREIKNKHEATFGARITAAEAPIKRLIGRYLVGNNYLSSPGSPDCSCTKCIISKYVSAPMRGRGLQSRRQPFGTQAGNRGGAMRAVVSKVAKPMKHYSTRLCFIISILRRDRLYFFDSCEPMARRIASRALRGRQVEPAETC